MALIWRGQWWLCPPGKTIATVVPPVLLVLLVYCNTENAAERVSASSKRSGNIMGRSGFGSTLGGAQEAGPFRAAQPATG